MNTCAKYFKITPFLYSLAFIFILLFFSHIPAFCSIILIETFDSSLETWIPFTNDDNKSNGWDIVKGKLVQQISNSDDIPGGDRYLYKGDVLDLREALLPINIYLDIMPLDYNGPNVVWFGFSFLVDSKHPDEGNVVVAIYKDQHHKETGLQVAIGKKRWVVKPNNFDFPLMQWCRMRIAIDTFIPEKRLHLQAKVWKETEPEPEQWMTETDLTDVDINWYAEGISVGAECLWGNNRNPIAAFDNIIIYDGDTHQQIWGLLNRAERSKGVLLSVFDEIQSNNIISLIQSLQTDSSRYSGLDETMFIEMLALRTRLKWEEARERANQFMEIFPSSPLCAHLGGQGGRTEDQAAVDFALALKEYHSDRFVKSKESFEEFSENYSNNWRVPDVKYYVCHCLYHAKNYNEFLAYSDMYIKEYPYYSRLDRIFYLRASLYNLLGLPDLAKEEFGKIDKSSPFYIEKHHVELKSILFKDAALNKAAQSGNLNYYDNFLIEDLNLSLKLGKPLWFEDDMSILPRWFVKTERIEKGAELIVDYCERAWDPWPKYSKNAVHNMPDKLWEEGRLRDSIQISQRMCDMLKNENLIDCLKARINLYNKKMRLAGELEYPLEDTSKLR